MENDGSRVSGFRYESAVPDPNDFQPGGYGPEEPEPRIGELGPGWDSAEEALAALQADFSRTVEAAPRILLWCDHEDGQRHAYLGKAGDWYFGADGGFDLSRNYVEAVINIAWDLRGAINDNLLGYLSDWPLCPQDGWTLTVTVDGDQTCRWHCKQGGHTLDEVGHLGVQ